jgi:preprotein translocase subunit Sec61beta
LDTAKRRRKKGFDTDKGFTRFFDSNKIEDMLSRDDLIVVEGMMQDY